MPIYTSCAADTYRKSDFFGQSMDMHYGRIASANNVFVFQDSQLRLELTYSMNRLVGACEYESRADILVINTAEPNPDVVTTNSNLYFLFHF
jgi:hypothetical protein